MNHYKALFSDVFIKYLPFFISKKKKVLVYEVGVKNLSFS